MQSPSEFSEQVEKSAFGEAMCADATARAMEEDTAA